MALRQITKNDLTLVSGKKQLTSQNAPPSIVGLTMDVDITKMIESVSGCIECAYSLGQCDDSLRELALDYVHETTVSSNFDLDGHFANPIPAQISKFGQEAARENFGSMPLWAPNITAAMQR